ncbi:MAG: alpha/beta fold hydrolase [Candidatus Lokiarchaeota archaeon]|nr:alpha/beta fold hydrolase [Candidatus Lokiarchaeota archaeon]
MQIVQYLKADRKRAGAIISIACIAAGLVPLVVFTFFPDPAHPYSIAPVTLTSSDGTRIDALVYTPAGAAGDVPGVVVGHGFTGNKRYMQPLSIELAKRGWAVVAIDFRGHGSSGGHVETSHSGTELEDDLAAGLEYLAGLGNVDRLGLVGHSMGGRAALGLAEREYGRINATVSFGMVTTGHNFTRIPNLLMAVGQQDQLFTREGELAFLEAYTGFPDVALNTRYGAFGTGDACKVATARGEHLTEPLNAALLEQMVVWFENAFHGGVRWAVSVTATSHSASLLVALAGTCSLVFVIIVYLSRAMWKGGQARPGRDAPRESSGARLVGLAIVAHAVGAGLLLPMSTLFPDVLPVSMGHQLFAILVGNAIGLLGIYYLLVPRGGARQRMDGLAGAMRGMCKVTPWRSALFGVLAAILSAGAITLVMDWSSTTTVLTAREVGAVLGMAIAFFPFLLVKEFYYRSVQERLAPTSRVMEYFKMVGIGSLVDNVVFVPIMALTWQHSSTSVAFFALSITVIIAFSIIQQLMVTWVYMHSGRNILGSTVFLCIFYAWMIVNFFPFGLNG